MSGDFPSERSAGARPVADAPVGALVARADELARRWTIALILARPLAEMSELPLEDLAREGPALCAGLVRALASDGELEQMLEPGELPGQRDVSSAQRLGALAVSTGPTGGASSVVEAVEALRGVIWEAALGELREPSARQVADLANRLGHVCAALLSAALAGATAAGTAEQASTPAASGHAQVLYSSPSTSPGRRAAVLIDEHDESVLARQLGSEGPVVEPAMARSTAPARPVAERGRDQDEWAARRGERGGTPHTAARPRPWDTPLEVGQSAPPVSSGEAVAPRPEPPDGPDPVMRVTRGPFSAPDERA